MKKILTAIGDEELNTKLRVYDNLIIVNQDIQYQEGIIEAIQEFDDIDMLILHEDIFGELDLEDLLRSIIILKNDIEIVLITSSAEIEEGSNIVKIIYDKENYVKEIENYLSLKSLLKDDSEYYKVQKIVNEERNENLDRAIIDNKVEIQKLKRKSDIFDDIKRKVKSFISKFSKDKEGSKVILVLGKAGVRKNNIYKYLF